MAQTFTRTNHTPQRITAENLAASVAQAGDTTLLDMVTEGCDKLSVQVDNTVQALDAFTVKGRVHRDASYITIASAAGDYSTPVGRMLRVTGAPVTLAAGASASFDLDVSGLYSVQILASGSNATPSVVSIYAAGGTAAGTPAANINATLTAGDIEVGAVELKNASTDDRALVATATSVAESSIVVGVKDPSVGVTTGAAVITDAAGTVQQYLRGLVARWASALGAGTEAAALRVTVATDSTGVLSVDDNGGSLTFDIDQTTPGTTDRVSVGDTVLLTSTPTLSVAGAYSTGDYIGPSTTPASFTGVSRVSGYANVVKSLAMIDKDIATAAVALELWLFSATFTAPTDNAAWTVSDGDMANFLGVIPIATTKWYSSAVNKGFSDDTLGLVIAPAVTTLFYALVARGTTPTWVNGDLVLKLGVLQK